MHILQRRFLRTLVRNGRRNSGRGRNNFFEVLNNLVPQEDKIGFSVIVFLMSKDQLISNIS